MSSPYRSLIPIANEVTTTRTVIRAYRPSDAEALYQTVVGSRAHIGRWMPWPEQHTSVEYSRDLINHFNARWLLREDFNAGVFAREGGTLLGGLGLHPREWDVPSFEIGYWLRRDAEGHGYMTEAAGALADYAFNALGARRVEIRCDARNTRSAAVAIRLGFTQEALLRHHMRTQDGTLRDTLIFARVV